MTPPLRAAAPLVRRGYGLVAANRSRVGRLVPEDARRRADLALARRGA
ncbi:MAG: hypothetical protein MUC84_04550 [Solirubrobacteraceae bacterium]|nr:hypothetical protein [Solirubrobacteraceae bacterium]